MIGIKNSVDDRNIPFNENKNKQINVLIDEYDANFLSYIARLYQSINGEKMNFENIKNSVDALAQFNEKQEYNYLNNLLYPERCKGVKIPSPVPVPSCSFQLHNCVTLKTNSSGNLCMYFNPFFLAKQDNNPIKNYNLEYTGMGNLDNFSAVPDYFSTFYVNESSTLNGHEENSFWHPIDIGQQIPPIYNQYRLVSASIIVKYIGRLDIASGVIGGGVVFDETQEVGCKINLSGDINGLHEETYGTDVVNFLKKYGNFDLIMDSFYHQENLCIEGMRGLYFPIDNSYEEYIKLLDPQEIKYGFKINNLTSVKDDLSILSNENYIKNGFGYMIYVLGAPPSSSCFKVDIYCNFECLPNAEFLNYLPLTLNLDPTTSEEKKEASIIIQQKPIMKVSETEKVIQQKPSIWNKMTNKFKNNLPGIAKMIAMGLKPSVDMAVNFLNKYS